MHPYDTAAKIDRYLTYKAARELYAPKPELCPNCKAEKSAWGRYGCDHRKWGPGVPDLSGLPDLYRSWAPRGVKAKRVSGARQAIAQFAFKADRVKVAVNGIDVSDGFNPGDIVNARSLDRALTLKEHVAQLHGKPGVCEDCGEKAGRTGVRLCGPCDLARYRRRCHRIAQHARAASHGVRSSDELFKILCVRYLTCEGEVRPVGGLAQDVLTKLCLMRPGRELDRIRRELLGEVEI